MYFVSLCREDLFKIVITCFKQYKHVCATSTVYYILEMYIRRTYVDLKDGVQYSWIDCLSLSLTQVQNVPKAKHYLLHMPVFFIIPDRLSYLLYIVGLKLRLSGNKITKVKTFRILLWQTFVIAGTQPGM